MVDEREAHAQIERTVDRCMSELYATWKEHHRMPPFFLAWPAEPVRAKDGRLITDVCRLELPDDRSGWSSLFRQALELTRPGAIMLVEQQDEHVRLTLESSVGATCWRLPIIRRGDVLILGDPERTVDRESLGLLWRARSTTS
jgi:hypothetical protein